VNRYVIEFTPLRDNLPWCVVAHDGKAMRAVGEYASKDLAETFVARVADVEGVIRVLAERVGGVDSLLDCVAAVFDVGGDEP